MLNHKWIFLTIGLVTGGAAGFYAGKKVYEKKANDRADQQIAEMQEYYQRADTYARTSDEEVKNEVNPVEGVDREAGPLSPEERKRIKKQLEENYHKTIDYASIYRQKNNNLTVAEEEAAEAESQHPVDSDEDEDADGNNIEGDPEEEVEDPTEEEMAMRVDEERKENAGRPPKIISVDSLGELPTHISHETLFYYVLDETVTDENDNVIDDFERLIGDALWKYNFTDSDDETTIYVRNFDLDTVYEVTKQNSAFYAE